MTDLHEVRARLTEIEQRLALSHTGGLRRIDCLHNAERHLAEAAMWLERAERKEVP